MSGMAYVEGPWEVRTLNGDWGLRGAHEIVAKGKHVIAEIGFTTPYCVGASSKDVQQYALARANAHLIAAAPDMYAALKLIYEEQGWVWVGDVLAKAVQP